MRCFAGSCRFVYNKGLALQKARFVAGEKKLSYGELCKRLTQWRSSGDTSWLKDAPTHPLQQALKNLERAYANFFAKRADLPRFKKKGQHDSFRYPCAVQRHGLPVGENPTRQTVAPAGSNRSSRTGSDGAEKLSGVEGHLVARRVYRP